MTEPSETMIDICPYPFAWSRELQRLEAHAARRGIEERPPFALILGSWGDSSDEMKKDQWDATVAWARRYGLEGEIRVADEEFHRAPLGNGGPGCGGSG